MNIHPHISYWSPDLILVHPCLYIHNDDQTLAEIDIVLFVHVCIYVCGFVHMTYVNGG